MNSSQLAPPTASTINPFAMAQRETLPGEQSSAALSDQQRQLAEVQAAIVLARQFPRDPMAAMDSILNACMRPTLAQSALYSYSRGGADVTGPSIRLAEALAQEWGNIQFGIRELDQRDGVSTVEAYAWDVQRNVRQAKTFQVLHERHTRKGKTRLTDPRDVYELVANQGARRLRSCILGVIPGDVIEAAVQQCETTMTANADTGPEAQAKLLEAFARFGVTRDQIEKRIQRRLDAITPAQVVALRKIHASLKDGISSADQWFEPAQAQPPGTPMALQQQAPAPALPQGTTAPAAELQQQPAQAAAAPAPAPATPHQPAYITQEQVKIIDTALQRLELAEAVPTIVADLQQRGVEGIGKLPAEHFSWFMACLQDATVVDHWRNGLSIDGVRLIAEEPPAQVETQAAAEPAPEADPPAAAQEPAPRQAAPVKRRSRQEQPQPAEAAAPAAEQQQELVAADADPDPFAGA